MRPSIGSSCRLRRRPELFNEWDGKGLSGAVVFLTNCGCSLATQGYIKVPAHPPGHRANRPTPRRSKTAKWVYLKAAFIGM